MRLIGRKKEMDTLERTLQSGKPEFLVVYGRRRVGKTYLIREYFGNRFSFYSTGVSGKKTREQLKIFHEALSAYGDTEKKAPCDWIEAFSRLRKLLEAEQTYRERLSGRRIVFLDELPWMDTVRSDFKSALDYFWNSWGSAQKDLVLIVCGSATSWILDNIIKSRGGFYNRITRQMHLLPFSLKECEELSTANGLNMTRRQLIESYMVFGGIPYYMNLFDRRLSLAQNIEELCFSENGELYFEHERLFQSLFRHSEKHLAIIREMGRKREGITRVELAACKNIGDGEPLTKALAELEQCGFIRRYKNYSKPKQGQFYQIIDPFILFCMNFLQERKILSWEMFLNTPGYYAWSGNAFETVCLNHIPQIKKTLGISGIESAEYAFRSQKAVPGAQIDLLIDRRDDVINICEMKYTQKEFCIDQAYERNLVNKREAFREETGTKKALHLTLITANGLLKNAYAGIVQREITGDDLFTE